MEIPSRMRAAWYERTGPAHEVLAVGDLPTAAPGPGQVLVRVAASGVNPHDTKKRSGWTGGTMQAERVIPHGDGAGTVVAVGRGVDAARVGERVWLYRGDAGHPGGGTAAEYCTVPAAFAHVLPDGVEFAIGAGLGVPAMTAHRAVFADGPVEGQTVLVTGGAGAVAVYAIQFARNGGARVLATASSAEKAAIAGEMGAEAVIDYRTEDVVARVAALTGGQGVHRIIEVDFGANLAAAVQVIRPQGVIAAYSSTRVREPVLPYYSLQAKAVVLRTVQGLLLTEPQRAEAVDAIANLLRQDRLRHPRRHGFPLARIADAHAALESGSLVGKAVLEIS